MATTDTWRDKQSGERQERTEWHRVVFFGRLAEIAAEYLRKGSQCYIEGQIRTNKWQGQDGQDRYTTEIIASEMQMLGSRGRAAARLLRDRATKPRARPGRPGSPQARHLRADRPTTSTTTFRSSRRPLQSLPFPSSRRVSATREVKERYRCRQNRIRGRGSARDCPRDGPRHCSRARCSLREPDDDTIPGVPTRIDQTTKAQRRP